MRTSEGENLKRGQREGRGGERGRDRVERPRQGREATGRRREGHREAPADGVVQRASGIRERADCAVERRRVGSDARVAAGLTPNEIAGRGDVPAAIDKGCAINGASLRDQGLPARQRQRRRRQQRR